MTTESQSFAGGDQNPWTSIPAGWSIVNGSFIRFAAYNGIHGNTFGQLVFDTYAAGLRTISAPMRWNSAGSGSEWGFCALNAARTGFSLTVKNAETTLRKEVAGSGTAIIATLSTTNTADATYSMDFNDSTGAITVKKNGTTVLTGTYTDTPTLKLGLQSFRSGNAQSYASVTIDYTPAQTVTSINGGVPITASQTSLAAALAGFTAPVTAIAATYTGGSLAISGIGGATNAPTFTKPARADGVAFPKSGTTVTFAFSVGAESASDTQVINKDAAETTVVVASPIIGDPAYLFGAIFAETGRTAANTDEIYHIIPPVMLTNGVDTILPADAILPNGEMQFYNTGTFPMWMWTAATGIYYYYDVTITESGSVIVETPASNTRAISNTLVSRAISNSITTLH